MLSDAVLCTRAPNGLNARRCPPQKNRHPFRDVYTLEYSQTHTARNVLFTDMKPIQRVTYKVGCESEATVHVTPIKVLRYPNGKQSQECRAQ
jgi:hypothetical protein